jgi:N-acetylmuramoyl-L-alanine amidase
VIFWFAGQSVSVPMIGNRVELLPVARLLGADAAYSPAAGTFGVMLEESFIQLSPGRQYVLVNGQLRELDEKPIESSGGLSASPRFLERAVLGPLGYHLELMAGGYRIAPGARVADPVGVRAVAVDRRDFTTLVITLEKSTPVEIESVPEQGAVIRFSDASPQLDPSMMLRSRRVINLASAGQSLHVNLAAGFGLLSWDLLENPPRIKLELGHVQPTPTPAPYLIRPQTSNPPIVIDPGHGGDDTGAVGHGLVEKDLTLAIALRLTRALNSRGHAVRLTRVNDEFRALTDRTALANRLEAKAFISLHANASSVSAVRGAETYYMSLDQTATDEAAAATASIENQAGTVEEERSPLDLILWDLAQSKVLNESAQLALATQNRLNSLLGLRDRGVKQAPFTVLTGATMPAVLIEVGFLSNANEAARLRQAEHQQRLAETIASGIDDYLRRQ